MFVHKVGWDQPLLVGLSVLYPFVIGQIIRPTVEAHGQHGIGVDVVSVIAIERSIGQLNSGPIRTIGADRIAKAVKQNCFRRVASATGDLFLRIYIAQTCHFSEPAVSAIAGLGAPFAREHI